jgi:ATP-binding cassette subfamily C (CFTR/MRP) protein 1
MADAGSGHDKEKEYETVTADQTLAVENTNHEEPLDSDNDERQDKEYMHITAHGGASNGSGSDLDDEKLQLQQHEQQQLDVSRTKSYATDASAITGIESHVDEPKKPWYKQLNPLRWGKVPPVPETRGVSREYTASFLSLVYFQWVAPMMAASIPPPLLNFHVLTALRLVTSDNSNKMIFGPSTRIGLRR